MFTENVLTSFRLRQINQNSVSALVLVSFESVRGLTKSHFFGFCTLSNLLMGKKIVFVKYLGTIRVVRRLALSLAN